ncbi:hypothetical protein RvVAR0630_40860 [Agrobacterium vitis]|nr:hypothetical protein RvVAR0630_40860 [Agrobacterium vitis]
MARGPEIERFLGDIVTEDGENIDLKEAVSILSNSNGSMIGNFADHKSLSGKGGTRFSRKDKRKQESIESVRFNLNLTDSRE